MTIFDCIKKYNEEMMAEFLCKFSEDIINNFYNYIIPSKENILNFLNKDINV